MLERLSAVAIRLQPWRAATWFLALAALIVFAAGVLWFPGTDGQLISLTAILMLLWALAIRAFIEAFRQPAPMPDPASGWLNGIRITMARGIRWFMALAIGVLFALTIWLTSRAILLAWQAP